MIAGIICVFLVLSSTFYFKSCFATGFMWVDKMDFRRGTMSSARAKKYTSNKNGNRPSPKELDFKGSTPGYEHIVFLYGKRLK